MKSKHKKRVDTVKKCKARIQDLLKQIVRIRDKRCLCKGYGECSGVLSADHIVSRTHSKTYGMSINVIAVCMRHHIWWKPTNPTIYTNLIDARISKTKRLWLEEIARPVCQYNLSQWQAVEENLKEELKIFTLWEL